jgi:dipeptidyl-peptidase 4
LLADVKTGAVRSVYQDRDKAWVDVVNQLNWVHAGRGFLWLSEQDGWRHVYLISLDGQPTSLVTAGDYDVLDVLGVDAADQWVYFTASPENATQDISTARISTARASPTDSHLPTRRAPTPTRFRQT